MSEQRPAGWPRIALVGPLPPPPGGMANQCEQLSALLRAAGATVEVVRTNAPYRPTWIGRVPMLRAVFRLLPYLWDLWRSTGRAEVVHVLANSGWAWHLLASPALRIARLRGRPAVVNYRGGQAGAFLARAPRHVHRALRRAALRVTPSAYLQRVFGQHDLAAEIVPNFVDLARFAPKARRDHGGRPQLLVSRNLEPIYGVDVVLRAFQHIVQAFPQAHLTIAGSGPQRAALEALATDLGVATRVRFAGRVDNADMPRLYEQADCMLNASAVDNMPNAVLEAFASGVPVVSTAAGGIPDMVAHGVDGLLVNVGDDRSLADATLRVLADPDLHARLAAAGLRAAQRHAWPQVRERWREVYQRALGDGAGA